MARRISFCAIISAIYAALTLAMAPIGYGPIQVRIAEGLVMLCLYKREAVPGVAVGCALSNLFSPLGIVDVVLGFVSSLLMCLIASKTQRPILSIFSGAAISAAVVGGELWAINGVGFLVGFSGVFAGECIALWLGWMLCKAAKKRGIFDERRKAMQGNKSR